MRKNECEGMNERSVSGRNQKCERITGVAKMIKFVILSIYMKRILSNLLKCGHACYDNECVKKTSIKLMIPTFEREPTS